MLVSTTKASLTEEIILRIKIFFHFSMNKKKIKYLQNLCFLKIVFFDNFKVEPKYISIEGNKTLMHFMDPIL